MPATKTAPRKPAARKATAKAPATKPPATVAGYLGSLPADRRRELEKVRRVVRKHLPSGYQEVFAGRMIAYVVPLSRYAETYNKQPLWFAALAAEKSYLTLHLMPVYGDVALAGRLRDGFKAAGKKLDMGKACIHFRTADDLALDTVAEIVAAVSVDGFVATAQAARRRR